MRRKQVVYVIALCSIFAIACSDDDPPAPVQPEPLYSYASFPIGVAVNVDPASAGSLQNNPGINSIAIDEFNEWTAENALKFTALRPGPETYFWDNADWFVNYAVQHHKQIHGHTLVWHTTWDGYWLDTWVASDDEWRTMLMNHINEVVTRYKGRIRSWDVVNEAFHDDGSPRATMWQQHIPDYIAESFKAANAADPGAELYYNDFLLEAFPAKLDAVLEMVDDLRSKGIRIDGIGFQMHTNIWWPSIENIKAAFDKVVAKGLKVKITEMDVIFNADRWVEPTSVTYTAFTSEMDGWQKTRYKEIVHTYCESVPADKRGGISVWGVSDSYSWLNTAEFPDWPLLFDASLAKKGAYYGFREGLK